MEKTLVLLLSLFLFCGSSQGKDYTIVVKTSNTDKAGTDAVVKIRVYGTIANIRQRQIRGSFEEGSVDTIHISDYDIGRVTGMALWRNQNGFFPNWRVDQIIIKTSGQADATFNINGWVSPDRWHELQLADVDECLNPSSCISPAKCINTVGSYRCECPSGYVFKSGSTKECEDVDECLTPSRCASPTTCVNSAGSFSCQCPSGYTKKSGTLDQCEDIDECANNRCDYVKSTCKNLAGSYKCNCKTGYKNLDAQTCINANECTMGTDSCDKASSECVDTEGNYYCRCKTGYTQGANNKICEAIPCSPLSIPSGSTLEPARCTQANANTYGDKCAMKCKNGYVIDDIQHGTLTCASSGKWEGRMGVCNPVACPALPAISNGNIFPQSCSSSGGKYTETCSYSCVSGYTLLGRGIRTCLADGTWNGAAPTCKKVEVKPWINCPDNIFQDLAPGKNTADVSSVWKEPTSNVQQITVNPPEISSSYQFPPGETKVEWTASNSQGSDSCAIYVIISDKEPPKIENCPSDIYETSDYPKAVTWVEPTFSDNVKVASVDKTYNSGDTFQLGSTNVRYGVFDTAGNKNSCQFTVHLKRPACHDPDGPLDGTKECSSFGGTKFCTVTCPSGSVMYKATSMFWQCNSGAWTPSDVIPDCVVSVKKDPNTPCEESRIEMSVLGFVGSELHCTKCPKGTHKSSTTVCSPCPAGTYNDQQGQLQCNQMCPAGSSSLPGAKSASDCRPKCPAGRYSADGLGPNCQDCPRDTYQDQPMSKSCISCPNGTFTVASGANSRDNCGSKPVATVSPLVSNIKERESVSVNCHATGTPTPTYKWTFSRDIPADFLGQMSQETLKNANGDVIGARLTITGATHYNTGSYECSVTNTHGNAMAFAKINVEKVFAAGGSGDQSL